MNYHQIISKVKLALLSMQRMAWEQGVAAQAFFEIGDKEIGILLAKEAVHRQFDDGRMAMISDLSCSVDSSVNGVPVLWAADCTGDNQLMKAAQKMADYLINKAMRNSEGVIYHFYAPKNPTESWNRYIMVDGIYHTAPFLVMAGYCDEALKQLYGMKKLLFNPDKKLYHQMWDDQKNDFARADFWGGGNGWMVATLPRVLKLLPTSMISEKNRLTQHLQELVDGILKYQRQDGLFHDVLDNSDTFVEATTAMMLSYAIFRGVDGGWLDIGYLGYANKIRKAVHKSVDEFGIVQGVCGAPTFNTQGTSAEAQAFFLLAEAAYYDMSKKNFKEIHI